MSLKALIEKQRAAAAAKAEGASNGEGVQVAAGMETHHSDAADSSPVGDNAVAPVAPKARLNFVGKAKPATPSEPTPVEQKVLSKQAISLSDIEDDEGTVPSIESMGPAFDDEIPATAPTRELPEDMSAPMKAFVTQLDSIYEIMHDPELFGQMIQTIMQELQENPDYIKLMADSDVHTMIRGLRSSMGLAKIKKAEKSTKGRAKKAPAASAMAGSLDEIFNSDDW